MAFTKKRKINLPNIDDEFAIDPPIDIFFDKDKNTYYVNLLYDFSELVWKLTSQNGLKCVFGKEFHKNLRYKKIKKLRVLNISKNQKALICEPLDYE